MWGFALVKEFFGGWVEIVLSDELYNDSAVSIGRLGYSGWGDQTIRKDEIAGIELLNRMIYYLHVILTSIGWKRIGVAKVTWNNARAVTTTERLTRILVTRKDDQRKYSRGQSRVQTNGTASKRNDIWLNKKKFDERRTMCSWNRRDSQSLLKRWFMVTQRRKRQPRCRAQWARTYSYYNKTTNIIAINSKRWWPLPCASVLARWGFAHEVIMASPDFLILFFFHCIPER